MNDWRTAYREQAKSDFAAAERLQMYPQHSSQATMLLQMAWEKLGKAAILAPGEAPPHRNTHKIVAKLVGQLRMMGDARDTPMDAANRDWLHKLQALLLELEALNPSLACGRAMAEYPWEEFGDVKWPAKDLGSKFTAPDPATVEVWKSFQVAVTLLG